MAQDKKIKISQIASDFGIKTKDVTDVFAELNIDKKSGATVTPDEYNLFLERITTLHAISDMKKYLSGESKITKKKSEEDIKREAEAKAKAEAEAKAKAEELKVKADLDARTKTQSATPKADSARKPAAKQNDAPERRAQRNDSDRRGGDRQSRPDRGYSRYDSSASFDPFAKRRENMQRQAEGFGKGGYNKPDAVKAQTAVKTKETAAPAPQKSTVDTTKAQPTVVSTTVQTKSEDKGTKPAGAASLLALEKQRQAEAKAKNAPEVKEQDTKPRDKREERREKKQQFKTITPTTTGRDVKGGVNISAEYDSTATQKTRVVDTRSTSDVNLSKYDDKYNEKFYSIVRGSDTAQSKQKLKKQDNRGQNAKSAKDKERAAQEKIKRLEAEKARKKQLEITVPDEISVGELAIRLKKTSAEVIKKLLMMGEMKTINDVVDYATAELIADEFGAKVSREIIITKEEKLFTEAEDSLEDLIERAPVVCVMGHVDHGKTSILDAIRHTNVTRGEAGGITQAIGAYRVVANGKDITFLDTPGHEAFTAMRMRGAKSTDIAILVVAADDGVMPQTVEAISHAKAAGIDIIVAINKMDKPTANPDNVITQLTSYDLVPEQWGGDVICVPVSAHTGMGINDLLDSVLLVAEVKELKANPKRRARGLVIESKLDRGRGPVATVLVQNGTLHQGDYVIVGNAVGRVRAMVDDKGKTIKSAGPSVPVEIVGLDAVPQAGDELNAVEDERMAKALAEERREKQRQEELGAAARVNLDELFNQITEGTKVLNIIVKADVAGSAEAVKSSLIKLSGDEVKVSVIHSAVGGITESDVMLATASNAIIVGFNVRPDKNALDSAERNNVDIRTHRVIYEIIDEVEAAMKGMLAPTYKEVLLGHAEVRQTIRVPSVGTIAGCYIKDGKITRSSEIRVVRDGIVIFEDKISSLKRFKDDVREVADGYECGVGLTKFNDIKEGDILEAFIMEEVKR